MEPHPSALTTVRITFRGMLGSFGGPLDLLLDERVVGKVYPGETVEFTVPGGRHLLRAEGGVRWSRSTSNSVAFDAGPGPLHFEVAFRDAYLPGTVGAVALFSRLSRQTQGIVLAISAIALLIPVLRNRKLPTLETFSLRRIETPPTVGLPAAEPPAVSAYVDMMNAVDPHE